MDVTSPQAPDLFGAGPSDASKPEIAPNEPAKPFSEVLQSLAERVDAGERLMTLAERPHRGLDATRLIALQAGIYRYTEAIELSSKLVDRTGAAVKTTLQGQ